MRDGAGADPRELILAAVRAGRYERAADPALEEAIRRGEDVPFDRIAFDSLGWMEFCISIELESGLELTPALVAEMRSTGDVARWIGAARAS